MFIYQQLFGALRMSRGYYQFQAPQLRMMPVPTVTREEDDEITRLVRILDHGGGGTSRSQALMGDIDNAIAALFKLPDAMLDRIRLEQSI